MGHSRITLVRMLPFAAAVLVGGPCSCSNHSAPTAPQQLITISGKVRNIDTAQLAAGVRVTLYGTSYHDVVPTGTDGAYSIQVPAHSILRLYTDDFDPANDIWFPLLNCDVPTINVDDISAADRTTWPIHCCPKTHAPQVGSVAVWDNYLENADDQTNGNIFAASSSANSGGILSILLKGCSGGTGSPSDSMSVSTSSAAFPVAYWRQDRSSGDPALGADIFYPSTRTVTDRNAIAVSFGDSSATDTSVVLTFSDMKAGRGRAWDPYECPVRKGMISLVWALTVDGITNKTFKEFAICRGFITAAGAAPAPYYGERR